MYYFDILPQHQQHNSFWYPSIDFWSEFLSYCLYVFCFRRKLFSDISVYTFCRSTNIISKPTANFSLCFTRLDNNRLQSRYYPAGEIWSGVPVFSTATQPPNNDLIGRSGYVFRACVQAKMHPNCNNLILCRAEREGWRMILQNYAARCALSK